MGRGQRTENRTLYHLDKFRIRSKTGQETISVSLRSCSNDFKLFFFHGQYRFFHQSHNTVHFGGLFTLKQWIFSSLKHDPVPRENKLYCFYVKNPPKRIASWDRENSQ